MPSIVPATAFMRRAGTSYRSPGLTRLYRSNTLREESHAYFVGAKSAILAAGGLGGGCSQLYVSGDRWSATADMSAAAWPAEFFAKRSNLLTKLGDFGIRRGFFWSEEPSRKRSGDCSK